MLDAEVGVQGDVLLFAKLLFDASERNRGQHDLRTRHQDEVVFVLAEREGTLRFGFGLVDVSALEMNMRGVDQHRTGAALVMMVRVNLTGLLEQLQRFA